MSFRTSSDRPGSVPLWGVSFKSPVVAVFDVLQSPNRQSPMALLQPQPRLQDFIPSFGSDSNLDVGGPTYVGLIPENRALFALSPAHYPLTVFAQANYLFAGRKRFPTIDAPPGYQPDGEDGERDFPLSVDDVTRMLKERARCTNGKWDRSCVVGARPVAAAGQSRLSRLLPDRPAEPSGPTNVHDVPFQYGSGSGGIGNESQAVLEDEQIGNGWGGRAQALSGGAMALAIFLVGLWYITRKTRLVKERTNAVSPPLDISSPELPVRVVDFAESKPLPAIPELLPPTDPVSPPSSNSDDFVIVPPLPKPPAPHSPTPDKVAATEGGEDGEGDEESGHEGDNAAAPGKKRGTRRRKRGKKNKGNVAANGGEPNEQAKKELEEGNDDAELFPPVPAPLMFSTSVQDSPPLQQLAVSEEILGMSVSFPLSLLPNTTCRLRLSWHCCLPWVTAGTTSRREALIARFRHSCLSRSNDPARVRRPPKCDSLLLPRIACELPLHRPRALPRLTSRCHRASRPTSRALERIRPQARATADRIRLTTSTRLEDHPPRYKTAEHPHFGREARSRRDGGAPNANIGLWSVQTAGSRPDELLTDCPWCWGRRYGRLAGSRDPAR